MRNEKICFFLSLFISCCLLLFFHLSTALAASPTTITSDYLEHFKDEDKYVATGNVKLEKDNAVVYADKAVLFGKAAYVQVEGHVIYEDATTLINAERAELSVDTRTGKMYNAIILLKDQKARGPQGKIDIWINSNKVEKIDNSHYYAAAATFTSCETIAEVEGRYKSPTENRVFSADNPDWCFKGSNVDILIGNRIAGDNMVYRVKGLPLVYSPYFRMPMRERQTGLLTPVLGNNSVKGFQFSPGFFWAIDENRDATLSLDYYSKRGTGEGLEYRYLDLNDKGSWFVYHLADSQEHKTDYVIKGMHDQKFGDVKAYVDVNYVNEWDYYNQFSPNRAERIERYKQSTGEISVPLSNSRLYLLGQYLVDLQQPPELQTPPLAPQHVPQRLPELGYVINTHSIGPMLFSMNSSIADFSRATEVSGQRLDINPTISHSFGNWIQVYQSLSVRETAYNLTNGGALANGGTDLGSSLHRETFTYNANALTRFYKRYDAGTNIIEPSLSYTFIPKYSHPLPLFDSVDLNNSGTYSPFAGTTVLGNFSQSSPTSVLLNQTSLAQFSVLDTLALRAISLSARITQPYDLTAVAPTHGLQPTSLSASLNSGPISLSMSLAEDLNTMTEQSFSSTLSGTIAQGTTAYVSRYFTQGSPSTEQYDIGFTSVINKNWTANGDVWYDNSVGLRDYTLRTIYNSQCWSLDVAFSKKPPDTIHPPEYSFIFNIVLKGIGGLPPYEYSTSTTQAH